MPIIYQVAKFAADGASFTDYIFKLKTVLTINGLWQYVQSRPHRQARPATRASPLPRTSRKAEVGVGLRVVLSIPDNLVSLVRETDTAYTGRGRRPHWTSLRVPAAP